MPIVSISEKALYCKIIHCVFSNGQYDYNNGCIRINNSDNKQRKSLKVECINNKFVDCCDRYPICVEKNCNYDVLKNSFLKGNYEVDNNEINSSIDGNVLFRLS